MKACGLQDHCSAAKNNYSEWLLGNQLSSKLTSLSFPILILINDLASHKIQCICNLDRILNVFQGK